MKRPRTPEVLEKIYAGWDWEVAWQGVPESITYRLSGPTGEVLFLKVAHADWHPSLDAEADRMRWAIRHLPVPSAVRQGSDGSICWLATRALPGRSAVEPSLAGEPHRLVRTLARGLRAFHGAPVESCPFDFRLDTALALARRRLHEGSIDPVRDFHPEHAHLSAEAAVEQLELTRPGSEDVVVCHGDYCLPNVLVEEWMATGFLDLGELGAADRWWDLAVATWSVTWNLGPGYEELFLKEYGVEQDTPRMEYFRLLYDVVS